MAAKSLRVAYDEESDVLYLSFGKPRKAISRELQPGVLTRLDLRSRMTMGLTIIDFRKRFAAKPEDAIPVPLVA